MRKACVPFWSSITAMKTLQFSSCCSRQTLSSQSARYINCEMAQNCCLCCHIISYRAPGQLTAQNKSIVLLFR